MQLVRCFIALCLAFAFQTVRAADLWVVSTDESQAFVEAREAMEAELRGRGLSNDRTKWLLAADLRQALGTEASAPKVVVTLGVQALRNALASAVRAQILATFIPRTLFEKVLRDNGIPAGGAVSAIYLDQPISRQLDLLRLALPKAKKVSVLLGPESSAQLTELNSAASVRHLDLMVATVAATTTLSSALQSVLPESDVLLALPDPLVYNSNSISNLLLSSYRMQVPMMAFSPAYVKAGALIALHSTSTQIGVQAAGIAKAMLEGEAHRAVSQYPANFTVSTNIFVARSLNISMDAEVLTDRLRRLEGRQ